MADEHPFAKHASVAIAVLSATTAIWTRFVVVEERQANQAQVIAELTREVAALRAKVEAEERATRERFYASDLRLSGLEDHTSAFVITTGRRRKR
jgi:hypothetical protein